MKKITEYVAIDLTSAQLLELQSEIVWLRGQKRRLKLTFRQAMDLREDTRSIKLYRKHETLHQTLHIIEDALEVVGGPFLLRYTKQ